MLAARGNGRKFRPLVIFKGKGKSKDDQTLKNRMDVKVAFNSSGWMSQEVYEIFVDQISGAFRFNCNKPKILVADSYKVHISEKTKQYYRKKGITPCIIPGMYCTTD